MEKHTESCVGCKHEEKCEYHYPCNECENSGVVLEGRRKQIGKKLRYEIFKRDKFTCQYCGRKAPDVVLEVDHIVPVSEGGTNDIMNLVTACWDCNRGKGKRMLSDDSVVSKNREDFEKMEAKQEQAEMLFARRKELIDYNNFILEGLCKVIKGQFCRELDDYELSCLKKYITKYSVDDILKAFDVANHKYSQPCVIEKIGAILYNWGHPKQAAEKYIKGCLYRNGLKLSDEGYSVDELKVAIDEVIRTAEDFDRLRKKMNKFEDYESLLDIFYEMTFEKEG